MTATANIRQVAGVAMWFPRTGHLCKAQGPGALMKICARRRLSTLPLMTPMTDTAMPLADDERSTPRILRDSAGKTDRTWNRERVARASRQPDVAPAESYLERRSRRTALEVGRQCRVIVQRPHLRRNPYGIADLAVNAGELAQ